MKQLYYIYPFQKVTTFSKVKDKWYKLGKWEEDEVKLIAHFYDGNDRFIMANNKNEVLEKYKGLFGEDELKNSDPLERHWYQEKILAEKNGFKFNRNKRRITRKSEYELFYAVTIYPDESTQSFDIDYIREHCEATDFLQFLKINKNKECEEWDINV